MAPGIPKEGGQGAGAVSSVLRGADPNVVLVRGEVELLVISMQIEYEDLGSGGAERLEELEFRADSDWVYSCRRDRNNRCTRVGETYLCVS